HVYFGDKVHLISAFITYIFYFLNLPLTLIYSIFIIQTFGSHPCRINKVNWIIIYILIRRHGLLRERIHTYPYLLNFNLTHHSISQRTLNLPFIKYTFLIYKK